jgi:hypothetical protein
MFDAYEYIHVVKFRKTHERRLFLAGLMTSERHILWNSALPVFKQSEFELKLAEP